MPLFIMAAAGVGFFTWAVFLILGRRAQRRAWLVWSAGYAALMVAFCVLEAASGTSVTDLAASIAPIPFAFAWFGGIVHVAVISKDATRRIQQVRRVPDGTPVLIAARERIKEREEGRRLAVKDPVLAREVGVGRPDVPGTQDFGLVDVNHAAPEALCKLPGITPQIADYIEQTRQSVGLFTSVEDLSATLDLPPNLTDNLREHAVFL
ncbi:helix-hairpin-helix domain-containing protein [Streptacidiphilus sp. PB12-B1b]|uniref:ComEA family DNA-binding protein n=1 Tax=Streptacidiphilus sp. PB12-B1b TaxID=2705012 RepID=UPI0015FAA15F|nr:helix-hairpin-helix domain-containing protein [Streptacidiphilus sp. PB12-B1b]QMU76939.1 helix-hairpin-helix domain-containing protein [Streptacidiphilus sp. PB12-B1b]